MCRRRDIRYLTVSDASEKEAVALCAAGCELTLNGEKYPNQGNQRVLESGKVSETCFRKRLITDLPLPQVEISWPGRAQPEPVPEAVPIAVQSQSTSGECSPVQSTVATSTFSVSQCPESTDLDGQPFPPVQAIPNIFEDEEQYFTIFYSILNMETKAKRREMKHILTHCCITWKSVRFTGEAVLESVEDVEPDDDIKVTDSRGNEAIFLVKKVHAGENLVQFAGNTEGIDIDEFSEYMVEYWDSGMIKRMRRGLEKFYKGHIAQRTAAIVLGLEKPFNDPMSFKVFKPPGTFLNQSQKCAVQFALAHELALIQGPPGTGKTSTAAVIVYNIFVRMNKQILVCASSNIAVDHLTLKVAALPGIKVLRIYGESSVYGGKPLLAEEFSLHLKVRLFLQKKYPATGDYFLDKSRRTEELLDLYKAESRAKKPGSAQRSAKRQLTAAEIISRIEYKIIKQHDAICCTCAMSMADRLGEIEFMLMDEAGFSAEPETLLPLLRESTHIIMIGDHQQLPPVVLSREAMALGYGRSMFERLIDIGVESIMLDTQYRMHPALSAFSRREFYRGKLKDGITASDRQFPLLNSYWQAQVPMRFMAVAGVEEIYGDSHSYCNQREAEVVEQVLYEFLQAGVRQDSVGIITPYDGQRRLLIEWIQEKGRCDVTEVEIKNVDGFQGREKDLIIISCVRSNNEAEIGFLTEYRRLNVAVTRAKYGLVIIGNDGVLKKDKCWRSLVQEFEKFRCVRKVVGSC